MNNKNAVRMILSLLIIVGFFLPWFKHSGSGFDILRASGGSQDTTSLIIKYSFGLPALFALIVFIRSIMGQSSSFLLRILPFLVIAILSALFVIGIDSEYSTSAGDFFAILGIGYYLVVVASFLLMFAGGRTIVRTA
jgi:hypothetical protein